MVGIAYGRWSLTRSIVISLKNFLYYRKLVAEERWSQPEDQLNNAMQCNAMQYSTGWDSTAQYSAIEYWILTLLALSTLLLPTYSEMVT